MVGESVKKKKTKYKIRTAFTVYMISSTTIGGNSIRTTYLILIFIISYKYPEKFIISSNEFELYWKRGGSYSKV